MNPNFYQLAKIENDIENEPNNSYFTEDNEEFVAPQITFDWRTE